MGFDIFSIIGEDIVAKIIHMAAGIELCPVLYLVALRAKPSFFILDQPIDQIAAFVASHGSRSMRKAKASFMILETRQSQFRSSLMQELLTRIFCFVC